MFLDTLAGRTIPRVTPAETLLTAAELIERDGLYHRDYWPNWPQSYVSGQPCCIVGALSVVLDAERPRDVIPGPAMDMLRESLGKSQHELIMWTLKQDSTTVASALRAAAA